jgi:hypothetical protein
MYMLRSYIFVLKDVFIRTQTAAAAARPYNTSVSDLVRIGLESIVSKNVHFSQPEIFGHQRPGSGLDPDADSTKGLDPDQD